MVIGHIKKSIESLDKNKKVNFVTFDEKKNIRKSDTEVTVSFDLAFTVSDDSEVHSPVMVFTFKLKMDSTFSSVGCKIAIERSALDSINEVDRNEFFNRVNSTRGTSKIYLNDVAVVISCESYIDSNIFEREKDFEDIVMRLANNCMYVTEEFARFIFERD